MGGEHDVGRNLLIRQFTSIEIPLYMRLARSFSILHVSTAPPQHNSAICQLCMRGPNLSQLLLEPSLLRYEGFALVADVVEISNGRAWVHEVDPARGREPSAPSGRQQRHRTGHRVQASPRARLCKRPVSARDPCQQAVSGSKGVLKVCQGVCSLCCG